MSVFSAVSDKMIATRPARQNASRRIASGYLSGKQKAAELAWSSMVNFLFSHIPDDFYDWQDPDFDLDPADDYFI